MIAPQALLAGGYAALLVGAAGALEWGARHTARRADRYRTAGFRYHPEHDLWVCPRDEPLWPVAVDSERRLVRYRARPTVCNACPVKRDCTSAHDGREIVRAVDPWPHSEAGRFHRAISVVLTVIALAFLAVAAALAHRAADLGFEAVLGIGIGGLAWYWARDLVRTPSGFPEPPRLVRPAAVPRSPFDFAGPAGAEEEPSVLVDVLPSAPSSRRVGTAWGFDRQLRRGAAQQKGRLP